MCYALTIALMFCFTMELIKLVTSRYIYATSVFSWGQLSLNSNILFDRFYVHCMWMYGLLLAIQAYTVTNVTYTHAP